MIRSVVLLAISIWLAGGRPQGTASDEGRTLIRHPTVSRQFVVFSYAGDLWRVARNGGVAERLTSGPDEDDYPVFAPNGLNLAFSRRGAEDWDVYTIGTQGGEPVRLTYNPELDIARAWSAGGDSVIFLSHRDEEMTFRLYGVAKRGGFPTPLPFPRAWEIALEPGGGRTAYVPVAWPGELFGQAWRYYRGGMTSHLSLVDLERGRVERVRWEDANDRDPMWLNGSLYFVSDRSGTFNLYSYDPDTGALSRHTNYEQYGIESASAGGGVIAFVQDGRLHIFTPTSGEVETLDVEVEPDTSELEPHVARGASWISSASPSPTGDRLILGMRGEVVSFDPASGSFENLTGSPGVAERDPAVSPDGRWIAYFSDESGDYHLHVRPAEGTGPVRKIPVELTPSFYRELTWSPDSKRLAFSDKKLTLWIADIETGGARRITTSDYSHQDRYHPAWSPDGTWLAYSRYEANRVRAIYLYHAVRGRKVRVTEGRVSADHPAFDKSGKYLYFVASGTAPLDEFGWSVLSGELFQPLISRRLQLVVLREGLPSPLLPIIGRPNPRADSLAPTPPGRAERRGRPQRRRHPQGAGGPAGGGQGPTVVDVAGLSERIVPLPLPAGDYAGLVAGGVGELYVLVNEWPASPTPGRSPSRRLYRYELSKPRELVKLIEDVDDFALTADGSKILYRRGQEWALVPANAPPEPGAGRLELGAVEVRVEPAAEWRQIYHEAWRLMDQFFYDPNHHGQDLDELERHYASYLPTVTRRRDLNLLLERALGYISASHLVVTGGDIAEPPREGGRVGLLGADYELDEGLYRIAKIYRSGPYNAGSPLLRAPLDQPGVHVEEGDYLLAVNGHSIRASENLYSYFEGTALRPTRITVSRDRDGESSRTYTVVPLPGENSLRRWNWAEQNRRVVAEESQGILGYVYVPDFSPRGLELVFQQLLANADKRGLIIDQRFAPGGITADYLIEMLSRSPLYYYAFRHGADLPVPTNPLPAAKVLLINDVNSSAAETFALMFKSARLGKVIGTRTAGAGIGPYGFVPRLIDGGRVIIPNRAAFNPAGSWDIENKGVEPDFDVPFTVADWWEGRDPQLGAAVKTVLQAIVDNPPLEVKRPDYPVHP